MSVRKGMKRWLKRKLVEQDKIISELSQEITELREVVERNALATNRELERVKSGKKRGFEKFFRKG
ncbi:TPA: hypothetical protein U1343_000234 [Streptococcus suis]|nr:hypothetical protein [Streptococcus suis]HEM5208034.1 hypothetical protein [Streptococcus suis]HEM5235387.1 hypothetical protein [Streptococcus suis]HEM5241416.1 hypothetical protein [Streptococcus suis]